ncbi:MAG: hypothetical protein Q8O63_10385, partial [Hoeflea sp.]|nr:hypothetical protein [Hoeflea sp.]
IHGATAIDALLEHMSDDIYQVLAITLERSAFGARPEIGTAFLQADLKRRRAEASMVESEAEMFQTISANLIAASQSPETFAEVAISAADLVSALAEKNATMGDGDPSGGTAPPEEPLVPTPPPGGSSTPPEGCYERYRRELSELWRNKDNMPAYDWWLQWADLLNKLVLCAGPAAAKALIDIIKAGGK